MAWSLHRLPVDRRANDALLAIGRALYIGASFEGKCKYLLGIASLDEAAKADPVAGLDDLITRLPPGRLLGPTLKELERIGPVSPGDAAVLSAAREARNYVAHEAGSFNIHRQPGRTIREAVDGRSTYDLDSLRAHLARLQHNVRQLARGDNLVSTWCFDVDEGRKEARPHDLISTYEATVERWVLEPVRGLLVTWPD